jgi:hypothetical protein
MYIRRAIATLTSAAALLATAQTLPDPIKVPGYTVEMTPLPSSVLPTPLKLPLEVDIAVAEEFVRIGFGLHLPTGKNFQSTQFLTPRLSTEQASRLMEMVDEYRTFRGKTVAAAVRRLAGQVSGIEFGREGPPVVYINLPYWTHQREGLVLSGAGTRISDDEHAKLVEELRSIFVGQLGAQEFSVDRIDKRRIRIWWHS